MLLFIIQSPVISYHRIVGYIIYSHTVALIIVVVFIGISPLTYRETLPILHKDKGSGDKEKGSDTQKDKGSDATTTTVPSHESSSNDA